MSANYVRLTAAEMQTLPAQKQAEIYDFVKFLKSKSRPKRQKAKQHASIRDLVGICESDVTDLALNHDKYLYD